MLIPDAGRVGNKASPGDGYCADWRGFAQPMRPLRPFFFLGLIVARPPKELAAVVLLSRRRVVSTQLW